MANTSIPLAPLNSPMVDGYNSFVTAWGDKRSATAFGISLVVYTNTDGYGPDGYAWLELSNAVEQPGSGYGQPYSGLPVNNNVGSNSKLAGDDATELTGSQQTLTLNPITGTYSAMWQVSGIPARWVRVRYTATDEVDGLTYSVYLSAPHESV
jgi:hypothetical protein